MTRERYGLGVRRKWEGGQLGHGEFGVIWNSGRNPCHICALNHWVQANKKPISPALTESLTPHQSEAMLKAKIKVKWLLLGFCEADIEGGGNESSFECLHVDVKGREKLHSKEMKLSMAFYPFPVPVSSSVCLFLWVCFHLLWFLCFTSVWSFQWRILFYTTLYLQGLDLCLGYTMCLVNVSEWISWWRVLCEACVNAVDEYPSLNIARGLCGTLSALPI